ncbi:MAG: hypothetical protein FWE23_08685 [Chitinivibrionia bacterium]|nr:hypothetical protein [Chitinivibrionia bacterium]
MQAPITAPTQSQITVGDWNASFIIIRTADDLRELSRRVASNNEAEHRNGFTNVIFTLINDINLTVAQSSQWVPIGTSARNFQGTFDGGNSVVRGIVVDNSAPIQRNLFGFLGNRGIIRNLGVNADVAEGDALVGLIGTNVGGKIENSFVERAASERPAQQVQQATAPTQSPQQATQVTVTDWSANQITIRTAGDLQELSRRVASSRNGFLGITFTLANNIHFSATQGSAWTTPIGNFRNGFRGVFNGENNVISGIIINTPSDVQNQSSLFGFLGQGGAIRNLGVVAVIREGSPLRALVDVNVGGVIENSYVERINTGAATQAQRISELEDSLRTALSAATRANVAPATAQPGVLSASCKRCAQRDARRGRFVYSVRPELVSNSSMTGTAITFEFGRISDKGLYMTWEFGGTPWGGVSDGGGGGTGFNIGVATNLEKSVKSVFGIGANYYSMFYRGDIKRVDATVGNWEESRMGFGRIFWKLMFGKEGNLDITNALMFGARWRNEWASWHNGGDGWSSGWLEWDSGWVHRNSRNSGFSATYILGVGYTLTKSRTGR